MPTYEYQCDRCGRRFEIFQRITERPKRSCPACRGPIRRLISPGAGVLFKGSGFYTTDYRSDSYKRAAKAESSAGSTSDSATGGSGAKSGDSSKATKKTET